MWWLACVGEGVDLGDSPGPTSTSTGTDPTSGSGPTTELLPGETGEETEPEGGPIAVLRIDAVGPIGSDEKVPGSLEVITDHDGTLGDLDSAPVEARWPIGIQIHGSSSTGYPKLGYRFECRDDSGEDSSCPLLDMPGASDWVLRAPYADKTLIREALAYRLAREVSGEDGPWQPRTAFAELILDEEYVGVYLLVERIQRDDDRLDLPKVAANAAEGDLSGGYVVKIDQHRGPGFDTARGTPIDYSYPRSEAITSAQDDWLRGWFDNFEAALADPGFADPVAGYPAWIVSESWIDAWLLNEIADNIDAYRLSAYHYKSSDEVDGRLYAGPVWDFDRAWGNVNYCDTWMTEGWIQDHLADCGCAEQFPFWWDRLAQDPAYVDARRCRWEELRAGVLADEAILATMDELVAEIGPAQGRDDVRWGTIGTWVDPNYWYGESYEEEVAWMKAWILERTAWMDRELEGSCD